jgi:conjugal transfer pilus assembly protein TraL
MEMNTGTLTVSIEQKLEVPKRFLFFTADDAAAFLAPAFIGFLSRHVIGDLIIGVITFSLWRRLKGEGGIERLKAAVYWFFPQEATPYRSFPRSDVVFWWG